MSKTLRLVGGAIFGVIGLSLMVTGASTNVALLTRIGIIITTIAVWVITWSK